MTAKIMIKESAVGLFWALLVLFTLFTHYAICRGVLEFRYVGY